MSDSEDRRADATEREALTRLEAAVGRLLEERSRARARAQAAEARVRDLETLLRRFTAGDADPVSLQRELERLQAEREELKRRIEEGRGGVDRLLSRVRFLEDQR